MDDISKLVFKNIYTPLRQRYANHFENNCMRKILLSLIALISIYQSTVIPQDRFKDLKNQDPLLTEDRISSPIPIVFGKKKDGFPEKLKVRGVIAEFSYADAYCGRVHQSGTIRMKVIETTKKYPYEDIYMVVPCFLDPNNEGKYLGKTVKMEVSKLYADYNNIRKINACYYELITNTIESHGVPFYCSRMGQEEIFANIEQ